MEKCHGMITTENVEEYTKLREDGVDFLIHKKYQAVILVNEANLKKCL